MSVCVTRIIVAVASEKLAITAGPVFMNPLGRRVSIIQ